MENEAKTRHGCVTAWLALMIAANAIVAAMYLLSGDRIAQMPEANIPPQLIPVVGICGVVNAVFAFFLFQWKRWPFYGFMATSLIMFAINLWMGTGIAQSVVGLIGVFVLYGILQIKENGVSAWEQLE